MVKGIAASSGIAIGKVFKLESPVISVANTLKGSVEEEKARFTSALEKTVSDINLVKERASANLSEDELAIFDAHLMMAQDPEYASQIVDMIGEGNSADYSCKTVSDNMIAMFESMDNDYFRERAADIKDVSYRLLCNILGLQIPDLTAINEEVIIVAHDLTPSDTASLNKTYTLGFCTAVGGRTSHSAIMARSLEIPAVVGTGNILESCNNGDMMILDAIDGLAIINPDEEELVAYKAKREAFLAEKEALKVLVHQKSVTVDGHEVELAGNIGGPNDVEGVLNNGGEGVGLFRTEFLYMNSTVDFPTEEEQFEAYKAVLEGMKGKKVVVRTLDIGGDKKLDYFSFPEEMNPFLGYRAIRFCLDRTDVFRTQLRALIRASVYGRLCVMFPMILDAKAIFEEEKAKLVSEGVAVADKIEVGMMVEIPASAVLADQFAKHADFFSIGTNDLIQYSMAADRMSEKVSYLYQPLNPSILRLVKMTIEGAHKNGKWVGMCGEMAGDAMAAPLLLGLGLDEFSMSATSILRARKIINGLSYEEMKELSAKAVECETEAQVSELVKNALAK